MATPVSKAESVNVRFYFLGQEANSSKTVDNPTIIPVNSPRATPEPPTLKTTFKPPVPIRGRTRFPSQHQVNKSDGVSIRDTFKRRRCGVFTDRYFEKGENIIIERPVFSCSRQLTPKGEKWPIAEEWCKLPEVIQLRLQKRFRKLRSVPIGQKKLGWYWKKKIKRFFTEYAFANPQGTEGHIYTLGSHMNHACPSCANAEQWTESDSPNRILVRLVKAVKANDEVFIYYNNHKGASLGCAKCGFPVARDYLGDIRRSISRLLSRSQTNQT
jgi:hypothetical protein